MRSLALGVGLVLLLSRALLRSHLVLRCRVSTGRGRLAGCSGGGVGAGVGVGAGSVVESGKQLAKRQPVSVAQESGSTRRLRLVGMWRWARRSARVWARRGAGALQTSQPDEPPKTRTSHAGPAADGAAQRVKEARGDGAPLSVTRTHAQARGSSRCRSLSCVRQGRVEASTRRWRGARERARACGLARALPQGPAAVHRASDGSGAGRGARGCSQRPGRRRLRQAACPRRLPARSRSGSCVARAGSH